MPAWSSSNRTRDSQLVQDKDMVHLYASRHKETPMAPKKARKLFVNLPVKDLKRSMQFFTGLGFEFNPEFTNDQAACMVVNDDAFSMLVSEPFFKTFT